MAALFFSHAVLAGESASVPVKKPVVNVSDDTIFLPPRTMIQVERYDAETRSYRLKHVPRPQEGPLDAAPESIAAAIKSLDVATLRKRPQSIVGNQYSTDDKLMLLFDRELAARRKDFATKKHP